MRADLYDLPIVHANENGRLFKVDGALDNPSSIIPGDPLTSELRDLFIETHVAVPPISKPPI